MTTFAENKVVVSAAVEPEQREELERLAREGDRTLSQQVRIAVREHLDRRRITEEDR
jgi:Ribbon-helix-helix protein, copG family